MTGKLSVPLIVLILCTFFACTVKVDPTVHVEIPCGEGGCVLYQCVPNDAGGCSIYSCTPSEAGDCVLQVP